MTDLASLAVRIVGDASGLHRSLTQTEKSLKGFGARAKKGLKDLGSGMTDMGASISLMAAPLVGFGALAISASVEFESAFANVEKTVEGTEAELSTLKSTLRSMATGESPLAAMDNALITLTGIAAMGGSLGVPTRDLAQFVETVALLDAASDDLDAEQAASFLGQFSNVTKMPVDDFGKFADVIVTLGNSMATTEGQIAAFGTRLAPLANYGWDPSTILAYSAALASLGVSPELGSTNLTKSIMDLTTAVATGGPQLAAWASAAGMSASAFSSLAKADPEGAFNAFLEGLSGMDASEQLRVLTELGVTGNEQISTLQRLAGGYGTLTMALDYASVAWLDNGAAMKEADAKANTTEGALNRLNNQFQELLITVGDKLSGALAGVATSLIPVIKGITDWAEANPQLVGTIAAVTLGLAGFGAVLITGGLALGAIGTIIGGVTTAFGAMGVAVGLVSWPILALGGALGLLVATWNALGPGMIESWGAAFTQIGIFIQLVIDKVEALISAISRIVMPSFSGWDALLNPTGAANRAYDPNNPIYADPDPNAEGPLQKPIPGLASGISYVPYDNFPAMLHKGERVVPATQNRGASGNTGPTINVNVGHLVASKQELMEYIRSGFAEAGY